MKTRALNYKDTTYLLKLYVLVENKLIDAKEQEKMLHLCLIKHFAFYFEFILRI